jgi:thymidine kinase
MENEKRIAGSIEIVCGSMFSGKTEELINRINGVLAAKQSIKVFKPNVDTRYATNKVVSHNNLSVEAIPVEKADEILQFSKEAEIVAIDEVQFFDESIISVCKQLAKDNKRVIAAGLDMDYQGQPFGPVPQLLAIADHITKLHTICAECGNLANFTYRKGNEEALIILGENDKYAALCRNCYNSKC